MRQSVEGNMETMKSSKRIALSLVLFLLLGLGLFPIASSAATIERSVPCSPNTEAANVTMNVGDTLVISTSGCGSAGFGGGLAGNWAYGPNGTETALTAGTSAGNFNLTNGDKVSLVATTKNIGNVTGITFWTGNALGGTQGPKIFITVNDPTPPTLSSSTPSDNATGVSVSSNIVLNFSESVKAGTGNILIKKTSDNTTITTIPIANGQITISGSTVTINPTADLDFDTGYSIEMASGVILDLSDNAFAGISGSTMLNFTTAAAPPADVPTISQFEDVHSNYFVVEGFKKGKHRLSGPMKAFIKREIDKRQGESKAVCTGTVRGKKWTEKREALALARAEAGCTYVSMLNPNLPVELKKRLISKGKRNSLTVRIRVIY